jgi:uncharacterized membrane protein
MSVGSGRGIPEECMNERRIHRIFEISILLKGAHALIECIGGLVLALFSTSAVANLVNALTQDELIEDPKDFVAAHLLTLAQNLIPSTSMPSTSSATALLRYSSSSACSETSSGHILFR